MSSNVSTATLQGAVVGDTVGVLHFCMFCIKINIQPVLSGFCRHSEKGIQTYHQYINHLYQVQEEVMILS